METMTPTEAWDELGITPREQESGTIRAAAMMATFQLRQELGITQKQAALLADVEPRKIEQIEGPEVGQVSFRTLLKVVLALGRRTRQD